MGYFSLPFILLEDINNMNNYRIITLRARLEMSSYGKGDIREPFVEAILYDGAKTLDFRYQMVNSLLV